MPTRLYPAPEALDPELVRAWAAVSTTIAADLFRGRVLADPAIRPLRPLGPSSRLAGRAVTAWCEPADYGPVQRAARCPLGAAPPTPPPSATGPPPPPPATSSWPPPAGGPPRP